jgi:nucleoside 2-deoxyribosyltransferase
VGYNAQESDTFGKDAELGVTLAQGKPVIVYVTRLFEKSEGLKKIYELIDAGARQ